MGPGEFRRWYETVATDLHRYLSRISDSSDEADDLFQEAFTRLLGSGFTSDDPLARRRYLFRIATNLARDRRRWMQRWGLEALRERGGASPEKRYLERVDAREALARLPPRSRELLWLAYGSGFTHKEIAEIVGVVSASVKVMLSRARRRFLANLERSEP